MGFFSKGKEESKESYTPKAYTFEESTEDRDLMTEKLFEVLSNCTLKLEFILNTFDIDNYEDFVDNLHDIDEAINDGILNQNSSDYIDISNMLRVLGYENVVTGKNIRFNTLSIKERLQTLIDESYNRDIMDIKFAAYIEDKAELFNSIPYDKKDEDCSIAELITLCGKLDNLRYNEFELEMR